MTRNLLLACALSAALPGGATAETCDFTQAVVSATCWRAEVAKEFSKGLRKACDDVGGWLVPGYPRAICTKEHRTGGGGSWAGTVASRSPDVGYSVPSLQGWPVTGGGQGETVFIPWEQLSVERSQVEALLALRSGQAITMGQAGTGIEAITVAPAITGAPAMNGGAIIPQMMFTPDGLLISR